MTPNTHVNFSHFIPAPNCSRAAESQLALGSSHRILFRDSLFAFQNASSTSSSGLGVDRIDEYLKLIFNYAREDSRICPLLIGYVYTLHVHPEALGEPEDPGITRPLSGPRLYALLAFYIGLCQKGAFNSEGGIDTQGMVAFIASRLSLPLFVIHDAILGSEANRQLLVSVQRDRFSADLRVHIGSTRSILVPSPWFRFNDLQRPNVPGSFLHNIAFTNEDAGRITIAHACLSSVQLVAPTVLNDLECKDTRWDHAQWTDVTVKDSRFERVDFSAAQFKDVRFSDCAFTDCNFSDAIWQDSELIRCHFTQCSLGVRNPTAELLRRQIRAGSRDLYFSPRANDRWAPGALPQTAYRDARDGHYSKVIWKTCSFNDCTFRDAVVVACRFDQCAWLRPPAESAEPSKGMAGAQWWDSAFSDCALNRVSADQTAWNDCSFARCSLENASFEGACLRKVAFSLGSLRGARFDTALLDKVEFIGAVGTENASFRRATIQGLKFSVEDGRHRPTTMRGVDFSQSTMCDVNFARNKMENANFAYVRFLRVTFRACDLTGVDFSHSREADLLASGRQRNTLWNAKMTGARLVICPVLLNSLESRDGRDLALNRTRNPQCFLTTILALSDFVLRVNTLSALLDHLERVTPNADDADDPILCALFDNDVLRSGPPALCDQLDRQTLRLVERQMPLLNRQGMQCSAEKAWAIRSADFIWQSLATRDDVSLCRYTPLIAYLLVGREVGAIRMRADTRVNLYAARNRCLPPDLEPVFAELAGCNFEVDLANTDEFPRSHSVFISANAHYAIVVPPEFAAARLGLVTDLRGRSGSNFQFVREHGVWRNDNASDTAHAIHLFPMLARQQYNRTYTRQQLAGAFALPLPLHQQFVAGLVHGIGADFTQADVQLQLTAHFAPLARDCSHIGGVDRAQQFSLALLPTASHQAEIWQRLMSLRMGGALFPDAVLSIALSCVFFRAASTVLFGQETESPEALRYYALTWANLGFQLDPRLLSALPPESSHIDVVNRALGYAHTWSCAGVIADILVCVLDSPLAYEDPNAEMIQAVLL